MKPTFKYLNDNGGVTLKPFSRFIKSCRKKEEGQSEKFKPVNKGARESESVRVRERESFAFEI